MKKRIDSVIKPNSPPDRRGAAIVEMAIVLPVFLLVLLGIIEFGRAMMVSQLVTTAARDAGRLAIMGGSSNAEVGQAAKDFLNTTLGVDAGDVTVIISVTASGGGSGGDVANAQQGDMCTIQVQVPFDKVGLIKGDYLAGKLLKGDCMMRHL